MVEGLCGLAEAAEDVPKGELWVVLDDLVDGEAFAKKTEDGHDRGPGTAHAGCPPMVCLSITTRTAIKITVPMGAHTPRTNDHARVSVRTVAAAAQAKARMWFHVVHRVR